MSSQLSLQKSLTALFNGAVFVLGCPDDKTKLTKALREAAMRVASIVELPEDEALQERVDDMLCYLRTQSLLTHLPISPTVVFKEEKIVMAGLIAASGRVFVNGIFTEGDVQEMCRWLRISTWLRDVGSPGAFVEFPEDLLRVYKGETVPRLVDGEFVEYVELSAEERDKAVELVGEM